MTAPLPRVKSRFVGLNGKSDAFLRSSLQVCTFWTFIESMWHSSITFEQTSWSSLRRYERSILSYNSGVTSWVWLSWDCSFENFLETQSLSRTFFETMLYMQSWLLLMHAFRRRRSLLRAAIFVTSAYWDVRLASLRTGFGTAMDFSSNSISLSPLTGPSMTSWLVRTPTVSNYWCMIW